MTGAKIPANHPHWLNYLLLLDIVDIVFAPVCTADIATYLQELIHEHHSTFQELYPHCPIVPKMHYMIHVLEWITR